jgi:hypothetical protein
MLKVHKDYLIDEKGEKKAVVVPFSEWYKINEALEALDDIIAYDKAKAEPSDPLPFHEAIKTSARGNLVDLYHFH